jgi:hypothetical protein
LGIGAELGVGDFADLEEVVDRDGAWLRGGLLGVGRERGKDGEEECCSEARTWFHLLRAPDDGE